jgi:3-oxoacyl-[acyl-carrier protein] reductase
VVLVTGAGVGIGRALCEAFAAAGDTVVVNDLDPDAAGSVAAALGAPAEAVPADVADVPAVRDLVAGIVARHGRLDVVVANAGITEFGSFLDYEPAAFERVTAVNLRGSFFTAQAAARAMVHGGHAGRIVLVSSVNGVVAMNGLSAYGATKAALLQLARALALELGPHGITVNAVAPGATVTERTVLERPAYERDWAAVTPARRTASVDDVAAAVLFLAGDGAAHVNGQTLVVDGGWTVAGHAPDGY